MVRMMFRRLVKQLDKYHPHIMLSCSTIGLGLGVSVGILDNQVLRNDLPLWKKMENPVYNGFMGFIGGVFIGTTLPILIPLGVVSFIVVKIDERIRKKNTNNSYNYDDEDDNENDDKNEK